MVAPYEADAQLAYLSHTKQVRGATVNYRCLDPVICLDFNPTGWPDSCRYHGRFRLYCVWVSFLLCVLAINSFVVMGNGSRNLKG